MEISLLGATAARALGFASALILFPAGVISWHIRFSFIFVLLLSALAQIDGSVFVDIVSIDSVDSFFKLMPSGVSGVYNLSIGVALGVSATVAIAGAFIAGRWILQALQLRFSSDALTNLEISNPENIALPIFLAGTLFVSDLFYYLFSVFTRSFVSLPLTNPLANTSSNQQAVAMLLTKNVISAGAEMISIGFLASLVIFLGSMIVTLSLIVGVRYLGKLAIRITDAGLSFVFILMAFSLTLYTTLAFIEKGQQRAEQMLSSKGSLLGDPLSKVD